MRKLEPIEVQAFIRWLETNRHVSKRMICHRTEERLLLDDEPLSILTTEDLTNGLSEGMFFGQTESKHESQYDETIVYWCCGQHREASELIEHAFSSHSRDIENIKTTLKAVLKEQFGIENDYGFQLNELYADGGGLRDVRW